jgi:hypothetical protein
MLWMYCVVALIFVGLYAFMNYDSSKRRKARTAMLESLIVSALPTLDKIVDGKRFLGSECEAVKTFRSGACDLAVRAMGKGWEQHWFMYEAEQLCRTKFGAWFLFNPETGVVEPCSERSARARLADDEELYVKVFGAPERA